MDYKTLKTKLEFIIEVQLDYHLPYELQVTSQGLLLTAEIIPAVLLDTLVEFAVLNSLPYMVMVMKPILWGKASVGFLMHTMEG